MRVDGNGGARQELRAEQLRRAGRDRRAALRGARRRRSQRHATSGTSTRGRRLRPGRRALPRHGRGRRERGWSRNIAGSLAQVSKDDIVERSVAHFREADPEYGERVAVAVAKLRAESVGSLELGRSRARLMGRGQDQTRQRRARPICPRRESRRRTRRAALASDQRHLLKPGLGDEQAVEGVVVPPQECADSVPIRGSSRSVDCGAELERRLQAQAAGAGPVRPCESGECREAKSSRNLRMRSAWASSRVLAPIPVPWALSKRTIRCGRSSAPFGTAGREG